jgi:aldehyde:ferredoxin oxidoreductase
MKAGPHGWCGKILKVDLSSGRTSTMDTMPYADRFLGGRGIATRIYWEEVPPSTGAFDPENRLIFMTGPLVATGTQGAARCMVIGKSPMLMPEGFCYGNIGSFFGSYLKRAGYDGLIIHGRSSKPVYLLIHDRNVQIHDASSLWGKGVYAAGNILKNEYGKKVRFITTGVAGENLCRSANLMTENDGSVTGGFGAVFGSKNLKAIAVLGSGGPSTAQPDKLKELNKKVYHLCQGPAKADPAHRETGVSAKTAHCYQCAIDCEFRIVARAASGKDMIGMCQAMFVYHEWIVDRNDEPEETAFDATRICNDLSICTMEMYNIIAWLAACFTSGYLTPKETGLHIEELGKLSFFEKLADMIAYRTCNCRCFQSRRLKVLGA